jgi:glucokinase
MDSIGKVSTYLTIEIGGTKLQLLAYTAEGEVLRRWRYEIVRGNGAAGIREQIAGCISEVQEEYDILKTGVGFGGPVNNLTGVIKESHQITGWSGFALSDWVASLTGSAVVVENDANTAALGEATFGAGRAKRTVFYVTIGSGVGGGMVQDGNLYHGREQGESEIGHLRLDIAGNTVENQCAGWAVDRKVREAVKLNPESILASLLAGHASGGETKFISKAIELNCRVAEQILDDLVNQLSLGLSHVVHLFNPDIIILGGGVSLIGERLRDGIHKRLPAFVLKALHPVPEIALAGLGEDVVPMGALALVLQHGTNSNFN